MAKKILRISTFHETQLCESFILPQSFIRILHPARPINPVKKI